MVVPLRTIFHVTAKSIASCHRRVQALHISSRVLKVTSNDNVEAGPHERREMNDASVGIEQVNVTKVKKKFSELPKVRVLPDGTVAKPLEEWWSGDDKQDQSFFEVGGTSNSSVLTERVVEVEGETCKPRTRAQRANTEAGESDGKPKKRKSSKKALVDDENAAEEQLPSTPRKRTRKKDTSDTDKMVKRTRRVAKQDESAGVVDDGVPKSALAQEIQENLSKFPHCLLLTRVGQFYESYFDQAIEIARILNIKLTSRRWGGGRVPMCGFPLLHIDKHLKVMVKEHKRFVAMCEEFPRYTSFGEREFERRVVRVITPGTLIDESFLNQYENNYLLAISAPSAIESNAMDTVKQTPVGLAWIDVSTGEFYSKLSSYENLRDEIARIRPQEIVLHKDLEAQEDHPVLNVIAEDENVISFTCPVGPGASGDDEKIPILDAAHAIVHSNDAQGVPANSTPPNITDEITNAQDSLSAPFVYTAHETSAIGLLTNHLRVNLLEHMPPLLLPNREDTGGRMQIDAHTIKALEIRENIGEGGTRGSLLSVIKRTSTTSGTRLLARWLCSPSTSIQEIQARQSLVAFFFARPHFRTDLLSLLTRAEDAGRIVQKFLLGKGDPSDLLALTATTHIWHSIRDRIAHEREMEAQERQKFDPNDWTSLDTLMLRMVDLTDLAERISMAVESQGPSREMPPDSEEPYVNEEGTDFDSEIVPLRLDWRHSRAKFGIKIRPEFSDKLLQLNRNLQNLWEQKRLLESKLQLRYDAPSLTLRSSPGQGMHVHLAKAKRDQSKLNADSAFVSMNESNTTKSYFHQEWAQLGNQLFTTSVDLVSAEREAFETLREEVNQHAPTLRRNARILDELDVTLAFANLATDMNFVRPHLSEDTTYGVINGRHPTVELGLLTQGRVFTPNSVDIQPSSRLHVITGPNMAGKSTLLRQTALIAILAQAGSFVPADAANLGIVDRLFSRVGARDDLFHDRSTFMVEMLETADILRRATPKSLVIMDEVGRGTTVNDGLAIAFATIHHLIAVNQCRTLFATHFHELADMLGYSDTGTGKGVFDTVSFYCTAIDEAEDGSFSYSYRMRPGINRDSHGLKVAQLAGMPSMAVSVAQDALTALKSKRIRELDTEELVSLGQHLTRS